jgi:hypothetical protein
VTFFVRRNEATSKSDPLDSFVAVRRCMLLQRIPLVTSYALFYSSSRDTNLSDSPAPKPTQAEMQRQAEEVYQRQQERMRKDLSAPYDFTRGVSDMCPVHNERMPIREVQMVYGELASTNPEPTRATFDAEFPFSRELWPGGCVVINGIRRNARFYVCSSCVAARKTWNEQHKSK